MIGKYSCPFLRNTGKACGNASTRPEECRFYQKAKKCIPCSNCGKPTASACKRYSLHIRGYYVPDTIIDFDQNYKKDFDQRYEKELLRN